MFKTLFLAIFAFFVFAKKVFAYLDPGSGSYIVQLLIGALVGTAFAVKTFWRSIKRAIINFFSRFLGKR